jgi:anti-anti-sigma factor
MGTSVTVKGQTTVVRPEGDIVAVSIGELRATLRDAVAHGATDLVLDLSEVRMVDSSGLGLLIAAHNSLEKTGGRLQVNHVSKDLLDLFKSMRLHQHFSVSGD